MDKVAFEKALQDYLQQERQAVSVADTKTLLRAMYYGDFDSGKTDLVAKTVKALGGRAMLYYTDSGWTTLQKYPEIAENIDILSFESFTQIRTFAVAHMQGLEPFCNYNTLIWDTASTGCYNTLRKLVANIKVPSEQKHPDYEGWTHYGLLKGGIRDLVEDLTKSNLNIIYTAHYAEPSKTEKEERVEKSYAIRPNIPEATFKLFAQECNLMGWLWKEKDGDARQITFEGTMRRVAKSQLPGIDERTYKVDQIPELIKKWQLS